MQPIPGEGSTSDDVEPWGILKKEITPGGRIITLPGVRLAGEALLGGRDKPSSVGV